MGKHDHDGGLRADLPLLGKTSGRRDFMRLLGGLGLVPLVGCSAKNEVVTAADGGTCSEIPEETAGPYPGDGSNGPNVLAQSGIVRRDIRPSFGASTKVAEGVLLTITLTLVSTSAGCAPLAGRAVYLWHCDRDGLYSLYSQGATNENYLRGVQETNANGEVTFTTVFPAAYSGRWPHVHFEVYPSLASATSSSAKVVTSQLALPEGACNAVYATAGYETSVANMKRTTLDSDNVFGDGAELELAEISGDTSTGYTATLLVGVAG